MPLLSDCSITISTITDTRRCLNTMVTSRIGYQTASQVEIHGLRPLVAPELEDLIQVLESAARDSLKSPAELNMMATNKLGLTHVIQLKIPLLRRTQAVPELGMAKRLMAHSQESELNAWASLKSQANPAMTETHRLGLMIANQEEIHLFKKMVKPELEVHTQVLELNAKDLIRKLRLINWLNMTVTIRLGSMTAIQVETHGLKPMVALVL